MINEHGKALDFGAAVNLIRVGAVPRGLARRNARMSEKARPYILSLKGEFIVPHYRFDPNLRARVTSRRVDWYPRDRRERAALTVTLTVDSRTFRELQAGSEDARDFVLNAANVHGAYNGGPGRWYQNAPHIIGGRNNRVAIRQTGGLDI